MANGGELAYQQLCGNITAEFNDCSKQVLEMISVLSMPEFCRSDLGDLLKGVQAHEKEKLHLQRFRCSRKPAGLQNAW